MPRIELYFADKPSTVLTLWECETLFDKICIVQNEKDLKYNYVLPYVSNSQLKKLPRYDRCDEMEIESTADILPFSTEELQVATRSLKYIKVPRQDGIPAEDIKQIAISGPEALLNMYDV